MGKRNRIIEMYEKGEQTKNRIMQKFMWYGEGIQDHTDGRKGTN